MNPPISPAEIAAVILAEALFGIVFNKFVEWAEEKHLWPTAISVVIGVAVTVTIPTIMWRAWILQSAALLMACFSASGLPMTIGSIQHKVNHKRRPLPNAAMRIRDDAEMDLSVIADNLANGKMDKAQAVHQIHQVIGSLRIM